MRWYVHSSSIIYLFIFVDLFNLFGVSFNLELSKLNMSQLPKLIAFDLDGTVWSPDMYMLWSGGSPFTTVSGQELRDSLDREVRLLGITAELFDEFMHEDIWKNTKFAWVSCTDEPDWAMECLSKFVTLKNNVPLEKLAHSSQIFKSNKQSHFQRLKTQFEDIHYSDMLFFDNEISNIRTVSKLGVKCVHCPDGITLEAWNEGLKLFTK